MCLVQGPQRSDAVRLEPAASQSQVKHSTTEPLRSLYGVYSADACCSNFKILQMMEEGYDSNAQPSYGSAVAQW